MDNRNENKNILPGKAEELISSYSVSTCLSKEEALNKLLKTIEESEKQGRVPVRNLTWFKAAASVAATVAILVTFWLFTATETVSSQAGETVAFRLPDDSRVVLHHESSLSYRKYLWQRRVNLQGEAYFEVEKGNGFHVLAGKGEVEVLGTRFLVKEEESSFTVQCYQGKVKAGYTNDSWILEPGTEFLGTPDKAGKKAFETETGYPQFARFRKSFENALLTEVLDEVEKFFGVSITLENSAEKKFSGTVETGKLENVLRIVTEPLQLKYIIEDKYHIKIHN